MTTTKAGGRLTGRVIVVHTDEGRLVLQIERTIPAPMLQVSDSAGSAYLIALDDYDKASANEVAQFFAAKSEAVLAKAAAWN